MGDPCGRLHPILRQRPQIDASLVRDQQASSNCTSDKLGSDRRAAPRGAVEIPWFCIALFEVARQRALARNIGPIVPVDIEAEYIATVRRLPELIAESLSDSWDFTAAVKLAGALIVAKGYPVEGHEVMQLESASDRQTARLRAGGSEIPW